LTEARTLEYLRQWMSLFAKGDSYTSLRKTLMKLPGGVPSSMMLMLPEMHLMRAIYKRLELMVPLVLRERIGFA